jgi:cytochrome P450
MAHLRGLPFVGVVPRMARMGALEFFEDAWQRHGDIFRVDIGPRRFVAMVHPDAIEHVLVKNRANYVKGSTYDVVRPLVGQGLVTLEGDSWKKRRRLAQPAFHRERLNEFVETMVDVTRICLDDLEVRSKDGAVLDGHREMMRLTLDIVGATLMNQRFSHDTKRGSADAFAAALEILSERGNDAFALPAWVPTPANLRLRRALSFANRMVHEVIREARTAPSQARTLLRMLLEARDADTGEGLSDVELRDEVMTLMFAGHETTALLLSWGFVHLGPEPSVVEKMRAEVDQVLGGRDPRAEDLPKLAYLGRVIDELLRLAPPAYAVARDIVADDVVMGHPVHAGEVALPLIYLVHQHAGFWDDAGRFDPERFRDERKDGRHHGAYAPFSIGARMCIGNVFALMEAKIILAMLLQRADFQLVSREPIGRKPAMTLRPATPIKLRMRFRPRGAAGN